MIRSERDAKNLICPMLSSVVAPVEFKGLKVPIKVGCKTGSCNLWRWTRKQDYVAAHKQIKHKQGCALLKASALTEEWNRDIFNEGLMSCPDCKADVVCVPEQAACREGYCELGGGRR